MNKHTKSHDYWSLTKSAEMWLAIGGYFDEWVSLTYWQIFSQSIKFPFIEEYIISVLPGRAAVARPLCTPGTGKPCGVLLRLSSKPSSLRGALGTKSSSGICFCLRRFLLHSSWQSCHKGRLRGFEGGELPWERRRPIIKKWNGITPDNNRYDVEFMK